jgi:hypothetical protein
VSTAQAEALDRLNLTIVDRDDGVHRAIPDVGLSPVDRVVREAKKGGKIAVWVAPEAGSRLAQVSHDIERQARRAISISFARGDY